ncbi:MULTISPECIES: Crp/Fnr family transcriptional regulator [unclassified Methylobacterium]|jgi:CRP-like cAMP-binding protein|uniref:Crp/Fnr family transcriptional regulator n=1 Tax=unclassified Methylobacterium TaxID=2615210 RepID=UPI001355E3CC|nr:Crp/Fnr family transcriptional regulator [Methylobacterium sp. 2A]MWV25358.1 Crp/Fnr family transcriptional regulator [Methylobacterium sp. 2A]
MLTAQSAPFALVRMTRPAAPEGFARTFGLPMRERAIPKQHDLLLPGAEPDVAHLLLAGHACRNRMLRDGRRQITAILIPGDICDPEAILAHRTEYAVNTLTRCTVGEIPLARIGTLDHQDLFAILSHRLRREEAIAREWIVSLGRRVGIERMAHLLCELRWRLAAVGLATEDSFELRITQSDFADALGLTPVHVNRVLKGLRDGRLIHLRGGQLTLLDRPRLEKLAQFDPTYLELWANPA